MTGNSTTVSIPLCIGVSALLLVFLCLMFEVTVFASISLPLTDSKSNFSFNSNMAKFGMIPLPVNSDPNIFGQGNSLEIVPTDGNERTILVNSAVIGNISKGNVTIDNISTSDNLITCNTLYGSESNFLGLLEDTPCTLILSTYDQNIMVDFDFQIIQNDDTNDITQFYSSAQSPENVTMSPGEIFSISRIGGIPYDDLNIYLIDDSIGDGQIIGLDNSNFVRINLDHFKLYNTDYFAVPNIYDYDSDWKLVIAYASNEELRSYFILDGVKIQ